MASPSGIPVLGDLQPGAHVGQFYWDHHDLLETLVPYFAAGLRELERCIWVTSEPLCAADARTALAKVVPDLADREDAGQIDIFDHDQWYRRKGDPGPDQVIQSWLDTEQAALKAGYRGLRVSGNTFWLMPDEWHSFAEYEARVHAAFRDRKIVAICSYSLTRCGPQHVVDVLSNHSVSLVRAGADWEVVHGATAALASLDANRHRTEVQRPHSVELYSEAFPVDRVGARLAGALERGNCACALVTREHGAMIRMELARRRVDIAAAIGRGQLAILDADAIFKAAWKGPGLNVEVVDDRVLRPVAAMLQRYPHCEAFGELVDLFAQRGDHDAAVELERWWNKQLIEHSIDLACGYSLKSFQQGSAVAAFHHVCAEHSTVGVNAEPGAAEADRLRAELAQVTAALANEVARRQIAEAAYTSARSIREHLVLLHRLTASLGEITSRTQLVEMVCGIVMASLEATSIAIVEVAEDGTRSTLLDHGPAGSALCGGTELVGKRALWSSDTAMLVGAPPELRAFALTPMMAGPRRLGTMALGFDHDHEFKASYRALAEDVARQIALALDRAVSYERLDHERERAEWASRAKDEFLAMLGHELRNPLSPILTATQLMRLRGEDVLQKERTVIERQVKHMIRLVDDLLDVSRITKGKVELRRRPTEISEIVAQAVELASPAMEERAHQLTLDVPNSGVVVHADAHRLAQVLTNLLTNAAKYTPQKGRIHLAVHSVDNLVQISVRDNGIGIDEHLLPHVFDLFVQGRQGIDRASGGLGLGLTIAKTLVDLHGGSIRAHSMGRGQGSEFVVRLPRYANTRPSTRNTNSGVFPLPTTRPCQVLVVDDNEDAAFLFSDALRKLGHHVEVAHDGPSALEVARTRPPEVAFLDIGLPVMDGYELGRRLKELVATPPKLIAVTGYGHTSDRTRSREAGFDMHLVKPIDLAAVQDALAKLT